MPRGWIPDKAGQAVFIESLAQGFDGFAEKVVENVKGLAPYGIGVHPPRGKKRPPLILHYRNTIRASTYLNGRLIAGRNVRARGFRRNAAQIQSIVYTSFTPFGHMFELTGAKPHDIPIPIMRGGFTTTIIVRHPGISRRPHFVPGLLTAASEAGASIRGRMLMRRIG